MKRTTEKKPSIDGTVERDFDLLQRMSRDELRSYATAQGWDNRSAFPRFKKALLSRGIDYSILQSKRASADRLSARETLFALPDVDRETEKAFGCQLWAEEFTCEQTLRVGMIWFPKGYCKDGVPGWMLAKKVKEAVDSYSDGIPTFCGCFFLKVGGKEFPFEEDVLADLSARWPVIRKAEAQVALDEPSPEQVALAEKVRGSCFLLAQARWRGPRLIISRLRDRKNRPLAETWLEYGEDLVAPRIFGNDVHTYREALADIDIWPSQPNGDVWPIHYEEVPA